jgi:hypothetical protein
MLGPLVATQSVGLRIGIAALLAITPVGCFLVGYYLLWRCRHRGLVEQMIEDGYEHPGPEEFLAQLGLSMPNSETVACPSCDFPTHRSLERCHFCDQEL